MRKNIVNGRISYKFIKSFSLGMIAYSIISLMVLLLAKLPFNFIFVIVLSAFVSFVVSIMNYLTKK